MRFTATRSRAPGVSANRPNSIVTSLTGLETIVWDGLRLRQRPLVIAYAGARGTVATTQAVHVRGPSSCPMPV
jgi:hypothetical protein